MTVNDDSLGDANFDPTTHKVFAVDWSLEGTSHVIARDGREAARIARAHWSDEDRYDDRDRLDCNARALRPDEASDDIPYGATGWGRLELTVQAALRLIEHPQPAPEPVGELRHVPDLEWVELAASYTFTRATLCVRDDRSVATDGARLHLVGREVREPGLWDILTGDARGGPYPEWEPLITDRRPRRGLTNLPDAWERIRAARDEHDLIGLADGGTGRLIFSPSLLLEALIGARLADGSDSRVLLGVEPSQDGRDQPLIIFMPDAQRSALVMPLRPGTYSTERSLDDLVEPLPSEEGSDDQREAGR